jgi:RsiW-degrading membrane proteinase PrsW (M82 family)
VEDSLSIRRSIWISSLVTLAALGVFILIASVIPFPEATSGRMLLGLFLAVVPAVIWLAFFYQQDHGEPEPKGLVARMFVFGALGGLVIPLLNPVITESLSQFPSPITRLIFTIFTVALLQETIKVAMVRYVVLGTSEFDRHPDGIVYGMASGLGFATVLTIAYVIESNGVVPLAGGIRAVNNALVHGALGAVSGYYLGRVKIDGKKLPWMIQGLAFVTIINAVYQVVGDLVRTGLTFNPWYSLIFSAVLAITVGAILFLFFRRALRRASGELSTVSMQIHARSQEMPWDIHVRYDLLLISALLLAGIVTIGAGLAANSQRGQYSGIDMQAGFNYPTGWLVTSESGRFVAEDITGLGSIKPTLSVIEKKLSGGGSDLSYLAAELLTARAGEVLLFRETGDRLEITVAGNPGLQVSYQFVAETPSGPTVVQAVDTYLLTGSKVLIFRYFASPDQFESSWSDYQRLLNSVVLTSE